MKEAGAIFTFRAHSRTRLRGLGKGKKNAKKEHGGRRITSPVLANQKGKKGGGGRLIFRRSWKGLGPRGSGKKRKVAAMFHLSSDRGGEEGKKEGVWYALYSLGKGEKRGH